VATPSVRNPPSAQAPTRSPTATVWRDAKIVVGLLAGKWVLDILAQLYRQPNRYSDLRRSIVGVKEKVLTETLQRMETQGLIARTVISMDPPVFGWSLTPLGRSLVVPVTGMAAWAAKNRVDAARGRATPAPRPAT
jgi:DNA-binding HxlR family transcriptional regulator